VKRLTVDVYALHYVLYLCTLNKSKLAGAASSTDKRPLMSGKVECTYQNPIQSYNIEVINEEEMCFITIF
jgi:hypothetical protein